jgi:hypothetical protein
VQAPGMTMPGRLERTIAVRVREAQDERTRRDRNRPGSATARAHH